MAGVTVRDRRDTDTDTWKTGPCNEEAGAGVRWPQAKGRPGAAELEEAPFLCHRPRTADPGHHRARRKVCRNHVPPSPGRKPPPRCPRGLSREASAGETLVLLLGNWCLLLSRGAAPYPQGPPGSIALNAHSRPRSPPPLRCSSPRDLGLRDVSPGLRSSPADTSF